MTTTSCWLFRVLLAVFLLWPSPTASTAPSHAPSRRSGSRLASFVPSRKKADAAASHHSAGLGMGRTRSLGYARDDRHILRRTRGTGTAVLFGDVRGGAAVDGTHSDAAGRERRARGISLSLSLVYLTVMGAKCALPSTLALLVSPHSGLAHHSTVLSRQDVMARLLAFSTLAIAAGKLVLGPVIDALGGVRALQLALAALGACLGAIGLGARTCPTLTALARLWIVVDFAFSSCWAACVKAIRDHLPEERWSKEIGRLAMAARSGNALSFAFFAWLLQRAAAGAPVPAAGAAPVDASWRWVFRAAGAVQLLPLTMLSYFGRGGDRAATNVEGTRSKSKSGSAWRDSLAILSRQARTLEFWLHLVSRSIIMVLVSFLLFIPSYMTQCYEMTSAASARVGSMFALGCLLAVSTLAEQTYPSVEAAANPPRPPSSSASRRKARAMLAFLSLAAACLALQASFLHNLIGLSPFLGTLLMFLLGFSLAVPFYLPSSMFALKRGGEAGAATIADAFDVAGFGVLALFNGVVARVLDAGGGGAAAGLRGRRRAWLPVFLWMLGGAVTAMATLFGAVWLEGERGDVQGVQEPSNS